jgi:hypothetical protein
MAKNLEDLKQMLKVRLASVYVIQFTERLEAYYSSLYPGEWSPASPFILTPEKISPGPTRDRGGPQDRYGRSEEFG